MRVIQGDITAAPGPAVSSRRARDEGPRVEEGAPFDAIVNAANSSLMGGGGVDGAIHRVGGPSILEECRAIVARQGECSTGRAVITGAGDLSADAVIHTVGPVWVGDADEDTISELDALLASCYTESVRLAVANGHRRIAFPNISTGVYRFPKERAAGIAIDAVGRCLAELGADDAARTSTGTELDITFVCFDDENLEIYRRLLRPPLVTRTGRPADAARIADYHHQCWLSNFSKLVDSEVMSVIEPRLERWNNWLAADSDLTTIVAVDDQDVPIGHTTVQGHLLVHLFIDPPHQGAGLGRQLLAVGEQLIVDGGHSRAELHTMVGNDRAIALYESCGWVVTDDTVDEVLPNGASYPEHVLIKDLRSS